MATDLKILGWYAKGLRCPDHDLSFEKVDGVHKISLVQMPNGTGKTTTLRLLRAALSGPDIWISLEKMQSFQKNQSTEQGQFELRLLHNQRRLTIELQFDFISGEVKYYTTSSNAVTGGKELGFLPPTALRPFLSLEFIKLLVFDGELAAQLLDAKHTNAQKAIEDMYQLTFFPLMKQRIEEYWSSMAEEAGSRGGDKELSRRKTRAAHLAGRCIYVKTCFEKDSKQLEEVKSTLQKLDLNFRHQIEKNKQDALKLQQSEADVKLTRQALNTKTRDLALLIKNPIEFSQQVATDIYALKDHLDRAKLPGIAAREFFDEIAEEKLCICEREIDSIIKDVIKTGAKKYLGSEEINVLNAMKTDIRNKFPDGLVVSGETLKQQLKELQEAQDIADTATQNLDAVKMNAGNDSPEMEQIRSKISKLNKEQGELENEMEKYEEPNDSDDSWNLEILTKRKNKADEELADTTGTIELKKKKDILHIILEKSFQKSLQLLSGRICDDANKKIKILMPHNNISIDVVDRSLRLKGKDGGSVGETLSVGYAFLSSLLSNTEQSLPLVVDSPSGPIDLEIRPEIAKLIPKLTDQFIAFTISSEIQGFVLHLITAASEEIHFVTLFRKGNKHEATAFMDGNNCKQSEDGIWVTGKKYFDNFHTEAE
ncbi:MAG: hypothetical protein EOO20_07435 [Chryseobacterium sp.]|nr:MAG: hypothetical protein EOO20_07435 [Chryseobacterium sp.]